MHNSGIFILDDDEVQAIKGLRNDFGIPKSFGNSEKYFPVRLDVQSFETVPEVVGNAIFETIGLDVPFDPMATFIYVRNGLLPEFVVAYFMEFQLPKRKISEGSKFYRAMHLISMFREYFIVPKRHFLCEPIAEDAKNEVNVSATVSVVTEIEEESTLPKQSRSVGSDMDVMSEASGEALMLPRSEVRDTLTTEGGFYVRHRSDSESSSAGLVIDEGASCDSD